MVSMLIRGLIIYAVVIIAVRLMGKRQIGELQPTELVITILLSQIASVPLQSQEIPLFNTLAVIFFLVALEILCSAVNMKSKPFRTLLQGSPILIIRQGHIIRSQLKRVRYTVEDLMEALRQKDIFDINQVQYAYIETNGSLSVLLRTADTPVTVRDAKIKKEEAELPCLVISDGKIIKDEFQYCSMSAEKLKNILKKENTTVKDVFIMTAEKSGKYNIIRKADSK